MILLDVNLLLYAFREDAEEHEAARAFLDETLKADSAFAVSDAILGSFIRVATHPAIFDPPTPLKIAIGFASALREAPTAVQVEPGPRHWEIFVRLCEAANAKGALVPDASLAAVAIESGCTLMTADRDFARFPGLRWENPLITSM